MIIVCVIFLFGTIAIVSGSNKSAINSFNPKEISNLAQKQATSAFEKEITIPSYLQVPARILFGIQVGETITIERFVVLSSILITLFTLILWTIDITPLFRGKFLKFIAGLSITTLVAMTGAINSLTIFFFNLGNSFEWLEALGPFQIFIGLAIAIAILLAGHYIIGKLDKHLKLEEATQEGENIGFLARMANITKRVYSDNS